MSKWLQYRWKIFLATTLTLSVAFFVQAAGARSAYMGQLFSQFKLSSDATAKSAGCQYCHTQAFGGGSWNAFGTAMKTQFKGDAKAALYKVLSANKDSDGDGYSDVLEVVAKTLPGDAKSKPTKPQTALQASLKKMGGLAAFK